MKGALNKDQLVEKTSLSMSTIDTLEKAGEFPKRFYITDRRAAWNEDEVESWLDHRQANSPEVFTGKKPPVEKRKFRPVVVAA